MSRIAITAVIGIGIALSLGGCPASISPPTGGAQPPADDPGTPPPLLSISVSTVNLQANEAAADETLFDKSAGLTSILTNFTSAPDLSWSLPAGAGTFIAFKLPDGTLSQSATGATATIEAQFSPATGDGPQAFTVTLTATLPDDILTAQISIIVHPDGTIIEGATAFSVNPFVTPATGVASDGTVVLDAGETNPLVGRIEKIEWFALTPLPSGITVSPPLSANAVSGPSLDVITLTVSGDVAGVFTFRVTVSDTLNNRISSIVNVFLGVTNLDVDVRATRIDVIPGGTVALRTTRTGGVPDADTAVDDTYTYNWKIFDETGTDVTSAVTITPANGAAHDSVTNDWTVTGLSTPDAYVFQVIVDDSAGQTDQDSTNVTIGRDLALAVEPANDQVGTSTNISLRTVRGGGEGSYAYTFEVFDQAGTAIDVSALFTPASGTASSAVNNDWTLAGFATDGHYRIFASVTDASGNRVTASTGVTVGDTLGLAVEASRGHVGTSTGFSLRTSRTGGVSGFVYSFRVLDQDGNTVTGNTTFTPGSGTTDNDADNDWAVSGFATAGYYRVFATVTDGVGRSVSASTAVTVGGLAGLDVQTAKLQFPPPSGASTEDKLLRTVRSGGIGTFSSGSYSFVVRDASGANVTGSGFTFAVDAASSGANAEIDWDVVIPAGLTPATYRFFCTVADAAGNRLTSSAEIDIVQPLGLDVQTGKLQFPPPAGATVEDKLLRTVRVGGTGTFSAGSYVFLVRDSGGADVTGSGFVFAVDLGSNAANTEINWDVTIPGGLTAGTYRFFCTVTDGRGVQFTSSTEIDIVQPLGLDVQTGQLQFPPPAGATVKDKLLRTVRVGGTGTFSAGSYVFLVRDSGGADVTGSGFVFAVDLGSNAANTEINWDVTIPGGLTAGTYRFFCTVTDSRGNQFTASAEILMVMPLGVDIQSAVSILGQKVPVLLAVNVTGGLANYTYTLTVVDSHGNVAGEFVNTYPVVSGSTTLTDTYAVPADGSGTYRITAKVVDAFGNEVNDTVHLFVTADQNIVIVDSILNAPATQPDLSVAVGFFEPGEPLTNGGSPLTFTPNTAAITNARNLTVLITDAAGGDLTVASVVVVGTNQRDQGITETVNTPAIGSTVAFSFPFKTITNVTVTYANEDAGNADSIEIGIGVRFGVAGRFPTTNAAAARGAFHILASGTTLDVNHKNVDVYIDPENGALFNLGFQDGGANQQFIQFGSPNDPDGTRDYIVQFGPG